MSTSRGIEAARAFVRIYADDKDLRNSLMGLRGQMKQTADAFAGMAGTAIFAGLGAAGSGMVMVAANAERSAVAMEVLLGSADRAKSMLDQIYKLAAESPFGAAEFTQGAQVLLNFGVAAKDVLPTLSMLGDISAGDAEKLSRLTMVFGQMTAAGRLMGQDLLQMVNAGFNPLQQISAKTGESMLDLKKRMEAGGISSQEVAAAFRAATSDGGRFFGMTKRIAGTTMGVWMRLKDQVTMLAMQMGHILLPAVSMIVNGFSHLLSQVSGFGKSIVFVSTAVAAFVGTMIALSLAFKAAAAAKATLMALSGPGGWATLAAGVAVAAGAVALLDLAQDGMVAQAQAAHAPLDAMAKDVHGIGNNAFDAAAKIKQLETASVNAQRAVDDMAPAAIKTARAVAEFKRELAASGKFGMIFDGHALVEQFREMESGYSDSLQKITDEIRILSGAATEAGIELEGMMAAGVSPQKIDELKTLIAKRDELTQNKKDAEFWKDRAKSMQESADEVKKAIQTVEQSFAKEQQRLQTLIDAGLLTRAEADKFLAQNPEFANLMGKMDPNGVRSASQSGPAQDLRSVAGASQITALINGTTTIDQKQLSTLQQLYRVNDEQLKLMKKDKEVIKV